MSTMVLHEVIWKRQTAINQLAAGLKGLNLLQLLKKHPDAFKEKFVFSSTNKITKELLLEQMDLPSAKNDNEEKTLEFFLEYLREEDQLQIGNGKKLYI